MTSGAPCRAGGNRCSRPPLGLPVADLVASEALASSSPSRSDLRDFSFTAAFGAAAAIALGPAHGRLLAPITAADVPAGTAVSDGLPETLEDYLRVDGIRYLKVKVAGRLDEDLARLTAIADLLSRSASPCAVTLDGNEQYKDLGAFAELVDRLRTTPALALRRRIRYRSLERPSRYTDTAALLSKSSAQARYPHEREGLDAFAGDGARLPRVHKALAGTTIAMNLSRTSQRNERSARSGTCSAEDLTNLPSCPCRRLASVACRIPQWSGRHHISSAQPPTPGGAGPALDKHGISTSVMRGSGLHIRWSHRIGSIQLRAWVFSALPRWTMTPPWRGLSSMATDAVGY